MRALSMRQPWAELVLRRQKKIETRKWNTNFRGDFFIHSPKNPDIIACKRFNMNPELFEYGKIVGKATIVDVKIYNSEEEFMKDKNLHLADKYYFNDVFPIYGFILDNVQRVDGIEIPGSPGFFEVQKN